MYAARILFVEDEPAVQELIRFTLEQAGMEAVGAASAEDALVQLNDILPDALLIDWMVTIITRIVAALAKSRTRLRSALS